jgi:hypothetical protein
LVTIKAYNNPPEPVKVVCILVMMFKPVDGVDYRDGWAGAKIMLNNPA